MAENSSVLDQAFDIDGTEGSPDLDILPKGNYVAFIEEAKAGALKNGRGQAAQLTWVIDGGKFSKRKLWQQVIVQHESEQAMQIGRQALKDICVACEAKGMLSDLTVLRNRPCNLYVVIEEDKSGEYPPKNKVSRVKPIAKPKKAGNGFTPVGDAIKAVAEKVAPDKPAPAKPPFDDDMPF